MRRIYIILVFLLALVIAEEESNALTTVDLTKLVSPGTTISEISANVQKKIIQMLTRFADGIAPKNPEDEKIKTLFGDACSSPEKAKKAINEIENGKGSTYEKLIKMIDEIIQGKISVIGQMVNLGLGTFLHVARELWQERWANYGSAGADRDKRLAKGRYSAGTKFPQGYEASMKFLDLIGPTNLPYWVYRGDKKSKSYYELKSEGAIDEYVTTAAEAVFEKLPKEKLKEFSNAIKGFDKNMIASYAVKPIEIEPVVVSPPPEPVAEPTLPETVAEPSLPEPAVELTSPEPVVEPPPPVAEPPSPESVIEPAPPVVKPPNLMPEVFIKTIGDIAKEVKEENAKKEVTDMIKNIIHGDPTFDEEAELAEGTGLTDLSKDELEEVIEKIEETVNDDKVEDEPQCGESTDEVEDALTDSLVEKVKDKLDDATKETIDDLIRGDEALDDLEEDIADEFELKGKPNENLEADLEEIRQGKGDLPEKIHKIIDELLPEELKEIADGKDEENEKPIEDLIESVIEDIPDEVVDIIEQVPKEDLDDVIAELDDKPVEGLEDKHEKELEKEAEEVTKEPYECTCDCDRK